ncbi:hypothetical protein JOM56_014855 [Amanita muscaria]
MKSFSGESSLRPEALIEDVLDRFKDFTLRIDLATLDDSNRDIEKYLVDQLSDIASKRGLAPTWPGPEIIEDFVFKSSGNFIFAATVMRTISDVDCDPEEQLDIVWNLKPRGDQDFLKTFLALLVGRSSIKIYALHDDDAMLMDVSEKKLHMKLRRMRSLLQFEPFIDIYHRSFLDFLQDPSRSGQYHVSKQGGQKRYLGLIVEFVVRHVSVAIEHPKGHEKCCSTPRFTSIVQGYPPEIVLPVEDWQETLKPLLALQAKLLNTLRPQPCHFSPVMRELLLHLVILQRKPQPIAAGQAPYSNMNETVTECSPTLVTEARQKIPENNLDGCLSALLSCLHKANPALAVDTVMIERMSSLLAFDHAETVARVCSVTDAQNLIDIIDLLNNNETFLSQCSRDAAHKAALLVSEIYARVPLFPRSVFLNGPPQQDDWFQESKSGDVELMCSTAFISRILDHNYLLPGFWIYEGDKVKFVEGNAKFRRKNLSNARGCEDYPVHSFHACCRCTELPLRYIILDSNLRAKIFFRALFAWQVREGWIFDPESSTANFTYETSISAFAELFQEVCFSSDNENLSNHLVEHARQFIERCRVEDPEKQPTMEDVVKEMDTWNLT